ncbi:MAG TPA: ATP-dependent DNA helicase RecG [Candidatus Binatia bacterium]
MKRAARDSVSNHSTDNPSSSVRHSLRVLATSIQHLNGVGPKRAAQLESFGLKTINDLLYHLPFRYEDRRRIQKLSTAVSGEESSFVGRLLALQKRYIPRRRSQMLLATLQDDTGSIDLVWYRAPGFLANNLANGQMLLVHGKVEPGMPGRLRIVHPDFDFVEPGEEPQLQRIMPVYIRPTGLSVSLMRRWIAQILSEYCAYLPNPLPKEVADRHGLMAVPAALAQLHAPPLDIDVDAFNRFSSPAHRTIIFEELFYLQLGLGQRKRSRSRSPGVRFAATGTGLGARMRELLPFELTGAQRRVLDEIESDMAGTQPMQRLVQGDVGSGKTMVAWLASLRAIEHGTQAIWMAPTEILAEQHYRNLKTFTDSLGMSSALLTAATPAREKPSLLQRIARGEISFVVGTHALIQQEVRAPRMGLGVIDEQHRFGVMQRLSLQRLVHGSETPSPSSRQPHMLLMSATPIPRSLAMVLYGDMEVSFIDEMPPGRTPVQTKVFSERERRQAYSIVLGELKRGHQVFVVLPLVEASEQLEQVRDATQMAEKMQQTMFKDFGIGLVHGRLKTEERDQIMRSFRDGKLGLLVATTVIEVGIDIPNATVMVVEHAERFGLSQLHQLRGRVGRGSAPGYCLLVNREVGNTVAAERLRVMEREHDGFKIAEADLRLRGPGELLGTRQSGLADFRFANLARDTRLLAEARKEALAWLDKDPELKSKASAGMKQILRHRWGAALQLGSIG